MRGVEMTSTRRAGVGGESPAVHVAVLRTEVVEHLLGPSPATLEGWLVDGTLGAGGHAAALLDAAPRVRLLGIDQDPEILVHARARLARFGARARSWRGR